MNVAMELSRILITELGEQQVIFLREKDGERAFPILIGISEALAIDRRLKHKVPPRPMTHDLLASVIDAMGGLVEKIVINDLRDHTFIATLHIRRGEESIVVDSRPSDAIALGVAFETPIFVADHVLEAVTTEPTTAKARLEILKKRLADLSGHIAEISRRLADQDFLDNTSPELVQEHRRQLQELRAEHEAIARVLKKLG